MIRTPVIIMRNNLFLFTSISMLYCISLYSVVAVFADAKERKGAWSLHTFFAKMPLLMRVILGKPSS